MDSGLVNPVHEALVQRLVDQRCLHHTLYWLRRTVMLLPLALLWAVLAARQIAIYWAASWFVAWGAFQLLVFMRVRILSRQPPADPRDGLRFTTRMFWIAGHLHALVLPWFFLGLDVQPKLLATLMTLWLSATSVVAASGSTRAYVGAASPVVLVLTLGWAWHGGVVGYGQAILCASSMAPAIMALRAQRRSWEDLVRLNLSNQALTSAVAVERDRAKSAADARTRFFAAASHDLRQPLHALAINATTLDLLAQRRNDAQLADLSQGIGRALAQSQGLLDTLLDISRLDAGAVRLHPAPCDLSALLASLRCEFEGLAGVRGLAFDLDVPGEPAWADTDTDQLLRILRNLLDNALKFTPAGRVRLSLAADPNGATPDNWRIDVADTGIGINPAEHDKVFEEFFQAGNPTRNRTLGLGLGLAIVRRTATLIGASVRLIRSTPGHGSVFAVTLPASFPAPAMPPSDAWSEPSSGRALDVLVVDDEPEVLKAMSSLLSQVGWRAHTADRVEKALALAADFAVPMDAALLDHRLPGTDGLRLLDLLRQIRPRLPALMVSGDAEVAVHSHKRGLPVLYKPIDGRRLIEALRELTTDVEIEHQRSPPDSSRGGMESANHPEAADRQ